MDKKSLYVVTLVIVGRVSLTIDTFVLGYSETHDEAINLLQNEYDRLCKLGYEPSRFSHNKWGWIYTGCYVISKVEINIAKAI